MNTRTRIVLTAALVVMAAIGNTAQAKADCKLKFKMSGWSAFYKRSSGTGTITCTNGQSMRVGLEARGGGPSVGKSTIKNGTGEFSGVDSINELLGKYASAEAEAGAVKSAKLIQSIGCWRHFSSAISLFANRSAHAGDALTMNF